MAHATPVDLLGAARSFIRRSTGTAALVIAPLAAVQLASSAKAQAVFTLPGSALSLFSSGQAYDAPVGPTGYFQATLPTVNSIAGALVGANFSVTINGAGGSGGYYSSVLKFAYTSGGTAFPAATIPVTYSFTLGSSDGFGAATWSLTLVTGNGTPAYLGSGSGFGLKSGTTDYTISSPTTDGSYSLVLVTSFSRSFGSGTFSITMDQGAGQGIALNATAIPEPSTYAVLVGLTVGVLALCRRRRQSLAIG